MNAGEYGAITAKDIRREALQLIRDASDNALKEDAVEVVGYIAGIADLAAAMIGEEDGE